MYRSINSSPILSIGNVNLKSGKSEDFNIYETWGEDTTYEIYKVSDKKFKLVATYGTKPLAEIGQMRSFINDQTRRYMFTGELVAYAVGSKLKDLIPEYGKSIRGFTYK